MMRGCARRVRKLACSLWIQSGSHRLCRKQELAGHSVRLGLPMKRICQVNLLCVVLLVRCTCCFRCRPVVRVIQQVRGKTLGHADILSSETRTHRQVYYLPFLQVCRWPAELERVHQRVEDVALIIVAMSGDST